MAMTGPGRTQTNHIGRVAGTVATAGLAGAAALHGLWAVGSDWPAEDRDDLADLVAGRTPFPDQAMTAGVAGLLGTASLLTAASAGLVPGPGGHAGRVVRLGAGIAAGALLARGAGGMVTAGAGFGGSSPRFRRWDLRVYSPLCLALGGAAVVSLRATRPRP